MYEMYKWHWYAWFALIQRQRKVKQRNDSALYDYVYRTWHDIDMKHSDIVNDIDSDMVVDTDSDMNMYRDIDMDMYMDLVNDLMCILEYWWMTVHYLTTCAWHDMI